MTDITESENKLLNELVKDCKFNIGNIIKKAYNTFHYEIYTHN